MEKKERIIFFYFKAGSAIGWQAVPDNHILLLFSLLKTRLPLTHLQWFVRKGTKINVILHEKETQKSDLSHTIHTYRHTNNRYTQCVMIANLYQHANYLKGLVIHNAHTDTMDKTHGFIQYTH